MELISTPLFTLFPLFTSPYLPCLLSPFSPFPWSPSSNLSLPFLSSLLSCTLKAAIEFITDEEEEEEEEEAEVEKEVETLEEGVVGESKVTAFSLLE